MAISEDSVKASAVVWKRKDLPGHEACRLLPLDRGWQVAGVAVLAYEGQACRLDYLIDCDPLWVTQSAVVTGWVGDRTISATIVRDGGGRWQLNGQAIDVVTGCSDIELNF